MRIAVFIDWENVVHGAKRAFAHTTEETIHPVAVGTFLAAQNNRDTQGELVCVEIHRGLPSSTREPDRHTAAWHLSTNWLKETQGLVIPKLRPLRYRKDRDGIIRGEEKGVDVQLAVSTIRWIMKNECDTAIIFSHDSDFSPLIEILAETEGPHCIETASWYSKTHRQRTPNHTGVYNHYLNHTDYLDLTQH